MRILILFRLFYESFRLALQQLMANKLRTILSLLGITIGIWCVIMVFSAVDSLEANIRQSFDKLGDDVVYVTTMPWGEDPRENFWKYKRRPEPSFTDYKAIRRNCNSASITTMSIFIGDATTESQTGIASNVFFLGVTEDYRDMFNLTFAKGRYFTPQEFFKGSNEVIIGHEVANTLFRPGENPVGQRIKAKGQRLIVVGVLEKQGKSLINPLNFDNVAIIPYNTARKYVNLSNSAYNRGRTSLSVKAAEAATIEQLKDELTGVLRASRRLKPREQENFSLNTLSILSNLLGPIFGVIRIAGLFIGIFAILVGMFSVANIMFVSVRERTNIIGIKKALGAKRYIILAEFLIESIVLCLIGGAIGLLFVYLGAMAATALFDFEIFLSLRNIVIGLSIATATGIIAGIIPALSAAYMQPVVAIRSK